MMFSCLYSWSRQLDPSSPAPESGKLKKLMPLKMRVVLRGPSPMHVDCGEPASGLECAGCALDHSCISCLPTVFSGIRCSVRVMS